MDSSEGILITCRSPHPWSASLFDLTIGTNLKTYKNGGIVPPKTLNLIGNDYIFTCDETQPLTHIWHVNSQEPDKTVGTVLPESPNCMALCPKSAYVAAGIGSKLYVWLLASGKLLSLQKTNLGIITCLKFSVDGNFLVVGGANGMVFVYKFVNLVDLYQNVQTQNEGQVEPVMIKHDHSAAITDLEIGTSTLNFVTISQDRTLRLYNLHSWELLRTVVFSEPLTALVSDHSCWNFYIGQESGKINPISVNNLQDQEHHIDDGGSFEGHTKRVTCLALAQWTDLLVSGSDDKTVIVWELPQGSRLKVIELQAEITNVMCVLKHDNFFTDKLKPKFVVKKLDRNLIESRDFEVEVIQDEDLAVKNEEGVESEVRDSLERLKKENLALKGVNQALYHEAMKLLKNLHNFN